MVSGFEPAIPLATHGQRLPLPVSNHENQSEARINAQMGPLYYYGAIAGRAYNQGGLKETGDFTVVTA